MMTLLEIMYNTFYLLLVEKKDIWNSFQNLHLMSRQLSKSKELLILESWLVTILIKDKGKQIIHCQQFTREKFGI